MNPKPRVVVVNVTSAPGALGGAVLAAQWHSWHMAKLIPIELWRMWDADTTSQLDSLFVRNFKSFVKFGSLGKFLPRLAKKVLLESEILKTLLANPPKIIHLQNPSPALEFEKIARRGHNAGSKIVVSTHGFQEIFDPQYGFDKIHQKIGWDLLLRRPLHRSFQNVDAFLLGFPKQADFLANLGVPRSKMHLVPNGVDPIFDEDPTAQEQSHVRDKFGLTPEVPVLLFMGNHTPNKGLGTLIELASRFPVPATFVVGGKLLSGEPEKWLAGVHIPPHVRVVFTDFLSNEEQRALYKVAKVFVFPSISETLPLVVLEAMASSLPVVAFDTGGISYQLDEGAGFAVPLNNVAQFQAKILELLRDPTLHGKVSAAARSRQRQIFDWQLIANKTVEVYDQLS